jgi:glyoxylase-like metal-dependent hydrolase (beta-lactamase superfamily II)
MTTFTIIDLEWTGRLKSVAALLIESGGVSAIIDPGPESTRETLREKLKLRGLDFSSLNSLLLTHIHLDHAGATGAMVRENPNLKVYVHEFGAIHMMDPSRLLASAGRLYGGDLTPLYGDCLAVPEENLIFLEGGEHFRIGDANLKVFYTPGHASHHVSYWEPASRTAFVGDTAGIRVQGESYLLPAAPPPDIDVEVWNDSLDTIACWDPERLFLTHFGFIEKPEEHIRLFKAHLADWSELTRKLLNSGMQLAEAERHFVDSVASTIKATLSVSDAEHYIFNAGLRLSWLGMMRYITKKTAQARPTA